jgi:hypothetical protein
VRSAVVRAGDEGEFSGDKVVFLEVTLARGECRVARAEFKVVFGARKVEFATDGVEFMEFRGELTNSTLNRSQLTRFKPSTISYLDHAGAYFGVFAWI